MLFVRFGTRKYPIKTFKQPSTVSFILHRRKINLFRSLGLIWLVTFRATGSRVIKWIIWSNIGVSLIWISWVQILHCSIKSIISCSGTWRYLLHKNSTFSLSCSKCKRIFIIKVPQLVSSRLGDGKNELGTHYTTLTAQLVTLQMFTLRHLTILFDLHGTMVRLQS